MRVLANTRIEYTVLLRSLRPTYLISLREAKKISESAIRFVRMTRNSLLQVCAPLQCDQTD